MFQNPKHLTRGIQCTLPAWLVILLWSQIERIPDEQRDSLQVFRLFRTATSPTRRSNRPTLTRWTCPARMR